MSSIVKFYISCHNESHLNSFMYELDLFLRARCVFNYYFKITEDYRVREKLNKFIDDVIDVSLFYTQFEAEYQFTNSLNIDKLSYIVERYNLDCYILVCSKRDKGTLKGKVLFHTYHLVADEIHHKAYKAAKEEEFDKDRKDLYKLISERDF